jgi:hypothetical protein
MHQGQLDLGECEEPLAGEGLRNQRHSDSVRPVARIALHGHAVDVVPVRLHKLTDSQYWKKNKIKIIRLGFYVSLHLHLIAIFV